MKRCSMWWNTKLKVEQRIFEFLSTLKIKTKFVQSQKDECIFLAFSWPSLHIAFLLYNANFYQCCVFFFLVVSFLFVAKCIFYVGDYMESSLPFTVLSILFFFSFLRNKTVHECFFEGGICLKQIIGCTVAVKKIFVIDLLK